MKMVVCCYFGILMYQHSLMNHTEQPQDSSFTGEHFAFVVYCLLLVCKFLLDFFISLDILSTLDDIVN